MATVALFKTIPKQIQNPVEAIEGNQEAASMEVLDDLMKCFPLVERIRDDENSLAVYIRGRRDTSKGRDGDVKEDRGSEVKACRLKLVHSRSHL